MRARRDNSLAAHRAMQRSGVGSACLPTICREYLRLTYQRNQRQPFTASTPNHLGLATLIIVGFGGEAYLGRLEPDLQRVPIGMGKVPASCGENKGD